jgi:hypothetical protein
VCFPSLLSYISNSLDLDHFDHIDPHFLVRCTRLGIDHRPSQTTTPDKDTGPSQNLTAKIGWPKLFDKPWFSFPKRHFQIKRPLTKVFFSNNLSVYCSYPGRRAGPPTGSQTRAGLLMTKCGSHSHQHEMVRGEFRRHRAIFSETLEKSAPSNSNRAPGGHGGVGQGSARRIIG